MQNTAKILGVALDVASPICYSLFADGSEILTVLPEEYQNMGRNGG